MSIGRVLGVVIAVTGCGTAEGLPRPDYEPVDTLAILEAAVHHHFPAEALDSAALDLEERTEEEVLLRGDLWRLLAERLEIPAARYSDVVHCEPGPAYERQCHVKGMRRLIVVSIDEVNRNKAIVRVSAWVEPVPGRVFVEGTQYLIEQQQGQWSVTKPLMSFAS